MLAKRIIPCLDFKEGKLVKGIKFQDHKDIGDPIEFAARYSLMGADELVFYDITASCAHHGIDLQLVTQIARIINIPLCVAGGIRSVKTAEDILNAGTDKIAINSPALENPDLINQLVQALGTQSVVIGIDSQAIEHDYEVFQYTGNPNTSQPSKRRTIEWIAEVQARGAGEIVLNCMNSDGVRGGYDLIQLTRMRSVTQVPLIASGGAGDYQHFVDVFGQCHVDGALAASFFLQPDVTIAKLKSYLQTHHIEIRP